MLVIVLVFGAASGLALAAATGESDQGTIHACAKLENGQLRVVSAADACLASEQPLALSAAGAGGPLAYAHVEDGALDAGRSKNVVGMTVKQDAHLDNVYCFVLASTPANVVATPETSATTRASFSPTVAVEGTPAMASLPCDPGTSAAVVYRFTSPFFPPDPGGFYATFN
jgi:hypothetical protein